MYVAIDLGTQSVKVLVVDQDGTLQFIGRASYPIHRPQTHHAEQNPDEWWAAVQAAMLQIPLETRQKVRGIGLTGQMHGIVRLDRAGRTLGNAIIWMDQRSIPQVKTSMVDWLAHTLNPLSTGFGAATLLWLKEQQHAVHTILPPKDWIRYQLTGVMATEYSDASGWLLLDTAKRAWSQAVLSECNLSVTLPPLMESSAVVGTLKANVAKSLGLPTQTQVVAGAADQAAMLTGSGAIHVGDAVLTIGTGGQLSMVTDNPLADARLNCFCHALPERWYSMGAILAAGYALSWWQHIAQADLETLLQEAASVPAGCEGLTFQPYLNGERTPHMNPNLTASFIGLTGRHGRGHMTRAVLEGVAAVMRDCLHALLEIYPKPHKIIFGGGGSQGTLWGEIIASTLNYPLSHLSGSEHTALGAAMLAAVGIGDFPNLESINWISEVDITQPNPAWVAS